MKTVNGKWIPEQGDFAPLRSVAELTDFIEEQGFLPYFKCSVDGFSAEEHLRAADWWTDDPATDPWMWRMAIASEGRVAYGKIFGGKAGFISREWYPVFASYRRDGYDFDSLFDDGLATQKAKRIMDVLEGGDLLFSFDLKKQAGFNDGETGFETTLTRLQMQTYVTIGGFEHRVNKRGEKFGWQIAQYRTPESLFGEEHVRSGYCYERDEAFDMLLAHAAKLYPDASDAALRKLLAAPK